MICCKCDVLPATCRVHTVATAAWKGSLELLGQDGPARWFPVAKTSYWCQICYERHEDHGPHEVFDLDSPSSSSEEDVGAAPSEHHCEDVAVSESSWQVEDAMSESSWHMQDDCSSTKSFNLTWHQVDEDAMSDASSQCSFMMVTPGSLAAERLHKHQPCDAAADAAATEDAVSTSSNLAIAQSSLHDQEHAPALQEHAPAEQEHQQRGQIHTILALHDGSAAMQASQPTSSSSSSPAAIAVSVGKWQEQQELAIALALPSEQKENSQLPSSSSRSSSSSSSSINSAAATAAVLAAAQQKKTKGLKNKMAKGPRWPLSDVQAQPLQPIQEQPILAIPYQSPSGCLETMFINQEDAMSEDDDVVAHRPCIKHGLGHHPHCRDCVNYQFMLEKSQHALAEQTALELSLDNSKIVGLQACSKHGEDFNQHCPTCVKICAFKDQWAKLNEQHA